MKHTESEIRKIEALIKPELIELLRDTNSEKNSIKIAEAIIRKNRPFLKSTLDMPLGGTLPPEELAEMMFVLFNDNQDTYLDVRD